jgi:hypothetical protein
MIQFILNLFKPKMKKFNIAETFGFYATDPIYSNGRLGSLVWHENRFLSKVKQRNGKYFKEGVDFGFRYAGGIIVFSTEVYRIIQDLYTDELNVVHKNFKELEIYKHHVKRNIHVDDTLSEEVEKEWKEPQMVTSLLSNVRVKKTYKYHTTTQKIFIKNKFSVIINNILKNTMIPKVFTGFKNIEGFSIGNFFEGRYSDRAYGRESRIYDDTSLSIEIVGIPFMLLQVLAAEIGREFKQKSVLVKDNASGTILLVNPDPASYSVKSKDDIKKDYEYYHDEESGIKIQKMYDYIYETLYSQIGSSVVSPLKAKNIFEKMVSYFSSLYDGIREYPDEEINSIELNREVLEFKNDILEFSGDMKSFREDLAKLAELDFYDVFTIHFVNE